MSADFAESQTYPSFDDLPFALLSNDLVTFFNRFFSGRRFVIAYSGGVDSHVLLHLCVAARQMLPELRLIAFHVNHGLQAQALEWEAHCESVCRALSVELQISRVDALPQSGQSPEEAARNARRAAFNTFLNPDDVLLTAQHADDQLETVLLQLFRGAGVNGLAAMPVTAKFNHATMLRPLLAVSRNDILQYARQHTLVWVEDPSNQDVAYQRNFLRQTILPQLYEQWPGLASSVSRTARHCAEAGRLLDYSASEWLAQHTKANRSALAIKDLLSVKSLQQRTLILRTWLRLHHFRVPSGSVLQRVFDEVIPAAIDRNPVVIWGDGEIHRYRDQIYLMPPRPNIPQTLVWSVDKKILFLGHGLGQLQKNILTMKAAEVESILMTKSLAVRFFRSGTDQWRFAGSNGHKSFNKLMQEYSVPAWVRPYYPVIFLEQQPLLVPGIWGDPIRLGKTSKNRTSILWTGYELGWKDSD